MAKKFNLKITILLIIILITGGGLYLTTMLGSGKLKNLKSYFSRDQVAQIKKYTLPYYLIDQLKEQIDEEIKQYTDTLIKIELLKKEIGSDIILKESITNLSNDLTLKKYLLTSGFVYGIGNIFPGSGYIDFHEDNIFIISVKNLFN